MLWLNVADAYQKLNEEILQIYDLNVKNIYMDKLDDIMNKYIHTYHSRVKVKPVYVHIV